MSTVSHAALLALALATALLLGGCAGLAELDEAPRVTLAHIEPERIQLLEQRYRATLRVQNPNPVELPIDGLEYTLHLNGSRFASGVSRQRVIVPAFGERTLEVSATSTILRMLEQLRRFADSGASMRYRITGTLGIRGLAGGVAFDHDGEVDLDDQPEPRDRRVSA